MSKVGLLPGLGGDTHQKTIRRPAGSLANISKTITSLAEHIREDKQNVGLMILRDIDTAVARGDKYASENVELVRRYFYDVQQGGDPQLYFEEACQAVAFISNFGRIHKLGKIWKAADMKALHPNMKARDVIKHASTLGCVYKEINAVDFMLHPPKKIDMQPLRFKIKQKDAGQHLVKWVRNVEKALQEEEMITYKGATLKGRLADVLLRVGPLVSLADVKSHPKLSDLTAKQIGDNMIHLKNDGAIDRDRDDPEKYRVFISKFRVAGKAPDPTQGEDTTPVKNSESGATPPVKAKPFAGLAQKIEQKKGKGGNGTAATVEPQVAEAKPKPQPTPPPEPVAEAPVAEEPEEIFVEKSSEEDNDPAKLIREAIDCMHMATEVLERAALALDTVKESDLSPEQQAAVDMMVETFKSQN